MRGSQRTARDETLELIDLFNAAGVSARRGPGTGKFYFDSTTVGETLLANAKTRSDGRGWRIIERELKGYDVVVLAGPSERLVVMRLPLLLMLAET